MGTLVETRYWDSIDCTGFVLQNMTERSRSGVCEYYESGGFPHSTKATCRADGKFVLTQSWTAAGNANCSGDPDKILNEAVATCKTSPDHVHSEEIYCVADEGQ
jgi:hypothetical protein